MNRNRLSLLCLLPFLCVAAAAQYTFSWYSPLVGYSEKAQSTIQSVKINSRGDVYTFASFGTNVDTDAYDGTGEPVADFLGRRFTGAPYKGGTSYGMNMLLVKHDLDGNIIWSVNSDIGDEYISGSDFVPTADGGAFVALKSRYTNKNQFADDIILRTVSNDGSLDSVLWHCSFWSYQPVFMTIDPTGNVSRIVTAYVDTTAMPSAGHYSYGTPDAFDLYAVTADDEGNFYVAGRLKKEMVIQGHTIPVHNTDGWDGDSQKQVGSLFILKLDTNLDYVAHLTSGGSTAYDQIKTAEFRDGKLYFAGTYKASASTPFTLGDKSCTPVGGEVGIFAAQLDKDLNVNWLTGIPGVTASGKNSIQLESMDFSSDGSRFYLGGGVQGGIMVGQSQIESQSSAYNGFIVVVNAVTGSVDDGTVWQNSGIGKVYGVIANTDSLYVYGYDWGRTTGKCYLDSYTLSFEPKCQYPLMDVTGMPTAWGCVAYGDRIIAANRAPKNSEVSFYGTDETYSSEYAWYGLLVSYTFDGYAFTPVDEPGGTTAAGHEETGGPVVYGHDGILHVAGAAGSEVAVYDLYGRCVVRFTALSDDETLTLQRGIYVVRAGAYAAKVML